jgi:hypothetical protein
LLDVLYPSENHDVHVGDENIDPMELNSCPWYDDYLDLTQKSPAMSAHDAELAELRKILKSPMDWWEVADLFESRQFQRMPVMRLVNQTML